MQWFQKQEFPSSQHYSTGYACMFQCVSALCYWGQPRFPRIQKSIRLALGVVMPALSLEYENGLQEVSGFNATFSWGFSWLHSTCLFLLHHTCPWHPGRSVTHSLSQQIAQAATRQWGNLMVTARCPQPSLIRWCMPSEAWLRTRASWNLPLSTPFQLPRAGRQQGVVVALCSPSQTHFEQTSSQKGTM